MAKDVTCIINGKSVTVPAGTTIINAAKKIGITITSFCYQPDLRPWGSCQMCVVNVLGRRGGTQISCATPVRDGMEVATHDEVSYKARQDLLKFFLIDHALDCPTCDASGECQLQDATYEYGVAENPFHRPKKVREVEHFSDLIDFKHDRCVQCSQCIRTCEEVIGASAITMANRGLESTIIPAFGNSLYDTDCTHCGMCVQVCPVGALTDREYGEHPWEMQTVRSICGFCPVGCSLDVQTREGDIKRAQGSAREYGVNRSYTCVQGRWGHDTVTSPARLETPLIRTGETFREATWEEALTLVASRLPAYQDGSFAAVSAPTLTNEDAFVLAQFTRDVMGSPHVDVVGRQLHAPGDRAMLAALGETGVTNSKAELIDAKMFLLVGTNMPETHPVLSYDLHIAVRTRDARMVMICPEWNNLCEVATVWLQVRPGTEAIALLAMANVITRENLHAAGFLNERVEGFDDWLTGVQEMTPERASEECGVPVADIERAARLYAKGGFVRNSPPESGLYPPSAAFFGSGIMRLTNGEETAAAVINLALLTGNVGRAGGGVWPLRDGTNLQGVLDIHCLPAAGGVELRAMPEAIASGTIRAALVSGFDPAGDPDTHLAEQAAQALDRLDFLVVHDLMMTETARRADVILPATTWSEVSGTLTNVDRHVQLLRPALVPLGGSRSLWDALNDLAGLMGADLGYADAADVFDAIAANVPSYAGLSHQRLDWDGGLQWPVRSADDRGTPVLFTDRFSTATGKARMQPVTMPPLAEVAATAPFGLILTTNRGPDAHGRLTENFPSVDLSLIVPQSDLVVHPDDARRRGIVTGDPVRVLSAYGELAVTALVSEQTQPGLVHLDFDLDAVVATGSPTPSLDRPWRIGELKVCAVEVLPRAQARPEMVAAGGD
ncbi:MAG: molybdopterin-dependent oxidoreductase [Thermomicrobia bacterium]|nr:molybdopterin-dependent oxidoreductase [Thermomicrobia bacterium]